MLHNVPGLGFPCMLKMTVTNIHELLDVLHYVFAAKAPVQMVPGSFRVRHV